MTMMKVALVLGGASAFVTPPHAARVVLGAANDVEPMDLDLEAMFDVFEAAAPVELKPVSTVDLNMVEGSSMPFKAWDPAGLASYGTADTLTWFRHAEVKHGRVCMAASVGWIVNEMGITFPGELAHGVPFNSLPKGFAAWDAVPNAGKLQMILAIGAIELASEAIQPHYLKGGKVGQMAGPFGLRLWDPVGTMGGLSEDDKKSKRQMEVNNGRLAMIGVASFFSATFIDGSVPSLPVTW